jgi:hypothetical protein
MGPDAEELDAEETGVSRSALATAQAPAARTVSHKIAQNAESPLAECSKKKMTPISTKREGDATATCARRRASNCDEQVLSSLPSSQATLIPTAGTL